MCYNFFELNMHCVCQRSTKHPKTQKYIHTHTHDVGLLWVCLNIVCLNKEEVVRFYWKCE